MKVRHHLSRVALVLAVAGVSAPLAQAGNLDDWFRDAGAVRYLTATAPRAVVTDDWFRGSTTLRVPAASASAPLAVDDYFRSSSLGTLASSPSPMAVDDYFRGAGSTASAQSPLAVDDYFRGAGSTAVATSPQSRGVADDYFRAPVVVPTGGNGFDWGDAGIGAAAGFGLALALLGGLLMVLRRRLGGGETAPAATATS